MRYKSIDLAAFGPFTDYKLDFSPSPDFHVIYGPNEAGKTSALRALIQALYGIPRISQDNHLHDNRKLRIGVELENANQSFAYIRRKRDKHPIIDPETEQPINDKILNQFLTDRNQNFFEKVYGLDHLRLREGGQSLLTDDGELGFSIFSAATGDIGKLQSIITKLDTASKNLFAAHKRGKGQLNQALTAYKETKKEANELMLRSRDWNILEKEYRQLKQEKIDLDLELEKLEKTKSKLGRIQRCAPFVTRLDALVAKSKELGDVVELSLDASERRKSLEQKITQATHEIERSQERLSKLEKEVADIIIPDSLLLQVDQIQDLVERLDSYRSNRNEIPALTGQVSQLKNQVINLIQEFDPTKNDLEDVEQLRIPFAVKTTLKQLSGSFEQLSDQLERQQVEIQEWQQELKKIVEQEQKLANIGDPISLQALVREINQEGKIENKINENQLAQNQLEVEIKAEIQQLGLWQGSYLNLLSLAVPQTETVVQYQTQFGELDDEIKSLTNQVRVCKQQLQEEKAKLVKLESRTQVPTDQELSNARSAREHTWQLLKRIWLAGEQLSASELEFTQGKSLEIVYEETVKSADLISDRMYSNAHNVGQKQALLNVIKDQQENHEQLLTSLDKLKQEHQQLLSNWNLLWQDSQITPLSPAEMKKWLETRQQILAKVTQLQQLEISGTYLKELQFKYVTDLREQLVKLGSKIDQNASLTKLLNDAELMVTEINQQISRQQHLAVEKQKTKARITKIEQSINDLKLQLEKNQEQWITQISQTKLPESFDRKTIVAYLEKLDDLFRLLEKYQEKSDQLQYGKTVVKQYQAQVSELVKLYAPNLLDQPEHLAIKQLDHDVNQGKNDLVKKEQLEKQIQDHQSTIVDAQGELGKAKQQLDLLMEQAQVKNLDQLKVAETRFQTYLELTKAIIDVENRLLEEGQGKSLAHLKIEVKSIDPDLLPSQVETVEADLQNLRDERDQKLTQFGDVEARYNEQVQGNNDAALVAAQHGAELMTTVKEKATDFLQYRLSLGLLRKSIEIYRDQNQGVIIGLASDIFARLTLGSFSGLKVDVDEKSNTIILGVRPDGGLVDVKGMSDGTLDQLYLALRLAIIENQLTSNEPMPLILDDVLINFDDQRSRAALEILADLATKTQVIFFTHHESLVDIATKHLTNKVTIHSIRKKRYAH